MLNIRKFLAIPYKERGEGWDGCNCWGIIRLAYREELHRELPDINSGKSYFIRNYYKLFTKVELPRRYDIVVFQNSKGVVDHAGLCLGYGKFLHCGRDGALVDYYSREAWKRRLNGFYRLKE